MSITIRITEEDEWIEFDIPTEWKDMSISYWAELTSIIHKHQEKNKLKKAHYEEKYEGEEDLDKMLGNIEIVDELRLNGDIFSFLSGFSEEDMKKVDMEQVTNVINALGVLTEEYKPTGARSFEFEDETYYFPSEMLRKNTYGDFIESTQLDMTVESMKNGRYDVLPEQMAILCRREGEEYDEDLIEEKTEKFKNLKMDAVMEFAFFLTNQSNRLQMLFNTYSEKKANP